MPHRLQWHEDDVEQMQGPLAIQLSSGMTCSHSGMLPALIHVSRTE